MSKPSVLSEIEGLRLSEAKAQFEKLLAQFQLGRKTADELQYQLKVMHEQGTAAETRLAALIDEVGKVHPDLMWEPNSGTFAPRPEEKQQAAVPVAAAEARAESVPVEEVAPINPTKKAKKSVTVN